MILCTGSQGEPMSALTRIAQNDHPAVTIDRGDTVILSAKPVPGNELRVHDTINRLAKGGAEVLHQEIAPVDVSGHGNSEEILDRDRARPAEGGDAGARGVPDAGRPRATGPRRRRAGGLDRDGRDGLVVELDETVPESSTASRPASRSWTGSEWGMCATSRSATDGTCPRTGF